MVFVMVHLVFRMVIGYLYIWNKMMMMMMMTVLAAARQVPVDNNFTDILPPFILQSTTEWEEKSKDVDLAYNTHQLKKIIPSPSGHFGYLAIVEPHWTLLGPYWVILGQYFATF